MRYPIYGKTLASSEVTVYEKGTENVIVIYSSEDSVDPVPDSKAQSDSKGDVVFYVDGDIYPFPYYFDLKVSKSGFTDKWIYNVWNFFDATVMTSS